MPTGTTRSSDGLDPRRKRVLFRAWHRGIKEMDMLLGTFADAHLGDMTDAELDEFEALMNIPDQDMFRYITGLAPMPQEHVGPVYRQIVSYHEGLDKNPSRVG